MKRLVAFWTFTCERCNGKESVAADPRTERSFEWCDLPKGWHKFEYKEYCEGCSKIIATALVK